MCAAEVFDNIKIPKKGEIYGLKALTQQIRKRELQAPGQHNAEEDAMAIKEICVTISKHWRTMYYGQKRKVKYRTKENQASRMRKHQHPTPSTFKIIKRILQAKLLRRKSKSRRGLEKKTVIGSPETDIVNE